MKTITGVRWMTGELRGLTRTVAGQKQFKFGRWPTEKWEDVKIDASPEAEAAEQRRVMDVLNGRRTSID